MNSNDVLLASLVSNNNIDEAKKEVDKQLDSLKEEFNKKLAEIKKEADTNIKNMQNYISSKPFHVNLGTTETPDLQVVHKSFNTVLNVLKSRNRIEKNIMLVGECGSGKSYLCSQVAKTLGFDYYPMSLGLQTTKSDLIGYMNAYGKYITTPIREAYENGGVLLLDEMDSSNAGVLTILNGILANDVYEFPDKKVNKNNNFICICACNTYGTGANINYIGRNRLDSATLDRFITIKVEYDEQLEKQLTNNDKWYSVVKLIRNNAKKNGLKVIVSPRSAMNGADLLDAGIPIRDVLDMTILKGVSEDVVLQLLRGVDFTAFDAKKPTSSSTLPPIDVYINIPLRTYRVEGIVDDTSIIHNQDWVANFDIFIGRYANWVPELSSTRKLFLNAGTGNFAIEDIDGMGEEHIVKYFLNSLESLPFATVEKQDIIITVNTDNASYTYSTRC